MAAIWITNIYFWHRNSQNCPIWVISVSIHMFLSMLKRILLFKTLSEAPNLIYLPPWIQDGVHFCKMAALLLSQYLFHRSWRKYTIAVISVSICRPPFYSPVSVLGTEIQMLSDIGVYSYVFEHAGTDFSVLTLSPASNNSRRWHVFKMAAFLPANITCFWNSREDPILVISGVYLYALSLLKHICLF